MYEIRHYLTTNGIDIFDLWESNLRDKRAEKAVDRRLARIQLGNFGDHKFCRDGVWELRIDFGPGYRLYYATEGNKLVILLCGGDKSRQSADIDAACRYWQDWKGRAHER